MDLEILGGKCKYRGPNGTSCAVGCLLTDEEVGEGEDSLDSLPIATVLQVQLAGRLPERLKPHAVLLRELQIAHDMYLPSIDHQDLSLKSWERSMKDTAMIHNLIYTPPPNQ